MTKSSKQPRLSQKWLHILISSVLLVTTPGCVEQKMSVKEARKVAVSMSGKTFTPPPRRIDDILSILDQTVASGRDNLSEDRIRAKATEPAGASDQEMAAFYQRRGKARAETGQTFLALEDFRKAYDLKKRFGIWDPELEMQLGPAEMQAGNLKRAMAIFQNNIRHDRPRGGAFSHLVKIYARIGDFDAARKVRSQGRAIISKWKRAPHWKDVNLGKMDFWYLTYQGQHAEAEPHIRRAIRGWNHLTQELSMGPAIGYLFLSGNLVNQGRLMEAEAAARRAVREALAVGRHSSAAGYALSGLGDALMAQGRLAEAERIYEAAVNILVRLGFPDDALTMGFMKILLGETLAARKEFPAALAVFNQTRDGLVANRFLYDRFFERRPAVVFTHLMAGKVDAAMDMIQRHYPVILRGMGKKSFPAAEWLAFRGMAHAKKKDLDAALTDFATSMPVLIEKQKTVKNHADRLRLRSLVEAYMDVLHQVRGSEIASRRGIDPAVEAFRMAETLNHGSVQKALGASGARAAVSDPDLADLVRQQQDTAARIKSLQETLAEILASPPDLQDPAAKEGIRDTITQLEKAKNALKEEIQNRFPKYADFVDPKPPDFPTLQRLLRTGEALVACTTTETRTYAWAVPQTGRVFFSAADIGRKEMARKVRRLRRALDPGPGTFGDMPEFDLAEAHEIYRQVLAPVAAGWAGARDLVVVASGPLGQIPLALLPTAPVEPNHSETLLFENYQAVPWLIRNFSITRALSATAFALQRQVPSGRPDRRAFAGFGDPIYNPGQLSESKGSAMALASRGGRLHVRGVRVTETGSLDNHAILSSQIERLNRLPDTADEIESIAQAIGAEPAKDVYLGQRASEDAVKSMNLSDRRVIAFASHALIPGDLDGLDQPALALSAPSVTGLSDDGLLTMGEVMHLNLNADWVVLSACNTGAAEGAGGEAVSGLGRAFFYAGTRALLVSMWPVETTSAKKLTTRLFEVQTQSPGISRARAFRQSVLDLMDGPGIFDQTTGKTVASYAHPLFWAPFIIVGEAGGNGTVSN
jgi:CHAT domain-containing protein/Flp pilus assembly protein TadD